MSDSSKQNATLWPIVCMGVGILIFGAGGAALGTVIGNETATIVCYVGGFLLGAVLGVHFGRRIENRRGVVGLVQEDEVDSGLPE